MEQLDHLERPVLLELWDFLEYLEYLEALALLDQ
jgi:hypothetical protein